MRRIRFNSSVNGPIWLRLAFRTMCVLIMVRTSIPVLLSVRFCLALRPYPVYSKGVEAQAGVSATNNPFTSVGAQYGRAYASGSDFACTFEVNEPSYLMVMATLVPRANYGSGIDHEFLLLNAAGAQVDLPDPLLENTGNEPIYSTELTGIQSGSVSGDPNPGGVFWLCSEEFLV